jgi:hypothetical protein
VGPPGGLVGRQTAKVELDPRAFPTTETGRPEASGPALDPEQPQLVVVDAQGCEAVDAFAETRAADDALVALERIVARALPRDGGPEALRGPLVDQLGDVGTPAWLRSAGHIHAVTQFVGDLKVKDSSSSSSSSSSTFLFSFFVFFSFPPSLLSHLRRARTLRPLGVPRALYPSLLCPSDAFALHHG